VPVNKNMPRRKLVSTSSQVLDSGVIAQFKNFNHDDSSDSEDQDQDFIKTQDPEKQNTPETRFIPFSAGNKIRDALFLTLICLAGFGLYFLYDVPSAIGLDIKTATNMSQSDFMFTFYTLYSYPSAVAAIFSGFLIDNVFGLGLGGVVFAGIGVLSQVVMTLGMFYKQNWLLGVGRFLHGTASEPLGVLRSTYNAKYFPDAAYYGLVLAASRAGAVGSFLALPPILCWVYEGSPSCLNDDKIDQNITLVGQNSTGQNSTGFSTNYVPDNDEIYFALQICCIIGILAVILVLAMMMVLWKVDSYFDAKFKKSGKSKKNKNPDHSVLNMNTVKSFPVAAWLLILIFMFFWSAIFPFNSMLPDYLKEHLNFDKDLAAAMSSVIYLLSVFGAPFFGKLVDLTHKHPIWSLTSCTILGVSHFTWGWVVEKTDPSEYQKLRLTLLALNLLNGLCYSVMASTISPWMGKMMPMKWKATAFGLLYGFQNVGLGSINLLLGYGVDKLGWTYFPFLCGSVSFIAAGFSVMVIFVEGMDPWDTYADE